MTKLCSTPAGAVLVAIDMAKNRQEVLIERPEGGRRRRMSVLATKANYDGLAEQLTAIGRPIVVGFEAVNDTVKIPRSGKVKFPTFADCAFQSPW